MRNNQSQINIPITGMDRDSHPTRLKDNSYSFAKNISLEDSSGNGLPVVQNEPSNILCQNFYESFYHIELGDLGDGRDYKIVGYRFNSTMGRTYFFFVNNNSESEFYKTSVIGYISRHVVEFNSEDSMTDCNCVTLGILDDPLEDQVQESLCDFKVVVQDSCNKCLGFSLDNPIYERNIRFKNEQCGRRMYWTDRVNPPRYLDLDLIENTNWEENVYMHTGQIVCGEEVDYTPTCFDCDKVKMIPDYGIPCIIPTNISLGGSLKLGTYEFLIAYCDEQGNELSNYFSHTNPVTVFDHNNVHMNQTQTDRVTSYAIELRVSNLDQDFHFYKVAVIQHTDVGGGESYFIEGIHPITDETVLYTSDRNKQATTLNNLLIRRPKVESIEQMIDSNGYLFMAGIRNKPVINFQPIVNLMGPYFKWQSIVAKEEFYKDGVNASTSRSFMRDEVYPLSLTFGMNDGTESNESILIGRAPTAHDYSEMVKDQNGNPTAINPRNLNVVSILKGKNACGGNIRKFRWQFENTAELKGESSIMPRCSTLEEKQEYIERLKANSDVFSKVDIKTCSILEMTDEEGEILNENQDFPIRIGGDYRSNISHLEYIISNIGKYRNPSNKLYNPYIVALFDESRYKDFTCSTSESCNCQDTSFIRNDFYVREALLEEGTGVPTYENYIGIKPISYLESQFPEGARDEDFKLTGRFVLPNHGAIHSRPKRDYGNTCLSPVEIQSYSELIADEQEGFIIPIIGSRTSAAPYDLLLNEYNSTSTTEYDYGISATFFEGGSVYRPKGTKQRYADETWNILRGKISFPNKVTKTALWLETKDLSESKYLQFTFSSQRVASLLMDENDLTTNQVLRIDDDVAYNKLEQVRVSIYDSCSQSSSDIKTPLKVLFLSTKESHLINLENELGVSSGKFSIAIDTPIIKLKHFTVHFTRNFDKVSDAYPDGQPTPEALRYVFKRKMPVTWQGPSDYYYFPNVNRAGKPDIGQVADFTPPTPSFRGRIAFDEYPYYRTDPDPSDPPYSIPEDGSTTTGSTTTTSSTTDDAGNVIVTETTTNSSGDVVVKVTTTSPNGEITVTYTTTNGPVQSDGRYMLADEKSFITSSTDWSFLILHRGYEVDFTTFNVEKFGIYKTQTYRRECYFEELDICDGSPFEEGTFGYVESVEEYPDNPELFDSTRLGITEAMVDNVLGNYPDWDGLIYNSSDDTFKSVFVDNFGTWNNKVTGDIAEFVNPNRADFTCKKIRHFRFPDNSVSPFIYTNENLNFQNTLIFPLGVSIDKRVVNVFLDLAVESGLMTQQQRDSIVYFKIRRGDRTLEKTVISKGLLTDVIKYKDLDGDRYFPNFPYNDLGANELLLNLNKSAISHPYNRKVNNKFVFNSPEIDYESLTTPTEIYVDGFQYGVAETQINKVKDHSKMVLLSSEAVSTADRLAKTESMFEVLSQIAELGIGAAQASSGGGFSGFSGVVAGAVSGGFVAAVAALRAPMISNRTAELRNKWIDIFKNKGIGNNFAHYITSVGHYNNFSFNRLENSKLRRIVKSTILNEGVYNITEPVADGFMKINNIDREKSMFLFLGNKALVDGIHYSPEFINIDNSSKTPDSEQIRSTYNRNIANLYAGLKVWKSDQYGKIENIKWIDITGCHYLNDLQNPVSVFFGGDTYISRYAYKRKFNYFLVSGLGQGDFTPFKYSYYFNVGRPKYYIDYETESTQYGKSIITTSSSYYNLLGSVVKGNYITDGMFFHYNYGIPYFFVESSINCWNRYAGDEPWENFYPNMSDYVEWTQESLVSIRKPNVLRYNYAYSLSGMSKNNQLLPNNFVSKFYNCTNNSPNGIMYSSPDASEKSKVDPWLVYKSFDFYNFPTSNGKLIDLLNIESTQILGLFENQVTLFNAVDELRDRINPENKELGTGGIFAKRPIDFHKTDLGYGGTQHKASVSNEFGHFWVDARRGHVHQVDPNGANLTEITVGMRNWFKENLPFKIMKGKIEGLKDLDLDNTFKNIGISLGWDSRYKRLFLTKLDYIVKPDYVGKLEFVFRDDYSESDVDLDFLSVNKYIRFKDTKEEVTFTNKDVFEPVHFTLAYSPVFKTWISYYDFTPGFYINYDGYFATGGNSDNGASLWSHLVTNKSYGVFYGKKYPWKIEIPSKEQYTQKFISNVEFWLDSIRYHNQYDYALNTKLGFDKAVVYNNSNSSGNLNLIYKEPNNRYQVSQYPKVTSEGTDILVAYDEGKWSFNDFYNRTAGVDNNVPLWNYDRNAIEKIANKNALSFNQRWLDRIKGDWFFIRFEGGSDTRFKQIFKWVDPKDNIII